MINIEGRRRRDGGKKAGEGGKKSEIAVCYFGT